MVEHVSTMDVWYARIDEGLILAVVDDAVAATRKQARSAKDKSKALSPTRAAGGAGPATDAAGK
jgi:hypothetical protein